MKSVKMFRKVWSEFHLVTSADAKAKPRQLYEILQLILRCQYTPDEYYSYRFFVKGKTYTNMLNYMSKYHSLEYYHSAMSDPSWSSIISDKLLFNAYFGYYALPVTNIYGYYCEGSTYLSDGFLLKGQDDLKAMLLQKKPEALVIKPAGGTQGHNLVVLSGGSYTDANTCFYRNNGEKVDLETIVQLVRRASKAKSASGAIIEEKLDQHELLKRINQSSVNTVRVVTQLRKNGSAAVCLAVLRLGRKGSDVDNVSQGGLFVSVDLGSGELGEGSAYTKFDAIFTSYHPDSEVRFSGLKIPSWEKIKALCINAAELAPFCRSIGWDVAITPQGPVLIEGNNCWAMDLQAMSNGFLQPELRKILAEYGLKFPEGNLPRINLDDLKKAFRRWTRHA